MSRCENLVATASARPKPSGVSRGLVLCVHHRSAERSACWGGGEVALDVEGVDDRSVRGQDFLR